MQQFFVQVNIEQNIEFKLNEDIAYQCVHVLRYQSGKIVRCVDLNGVVGLCSIRINNEDVYAYVKEILNNDSEMKIKVTLIQALIRKERWEFLIQKATELGVYRIVPIELKRNIVHWDKNESRNKHDRYQKIMIEAAEQSKRTIIPKLETIIRINELEQYKSEINLVAYENESHIHLRECINSKRSITIICGPEGGFEESEINYLNSQGFKSVSLGKRILRAETAGLYILSGIDFMFEESNYE
jgi:16S rRNA (uracil1498-N3)-methyltransferase